MHADQPSELQDTVSGMRRILTAQTRLVDQCLDDLKRIRDGDASLAAGVDPKVFDVVPTMIHVAGISAHSVLKLTEDTNLQVRDTYPIARSIIETVINVGFIMATGNTAAEAADKHAQQKVFRDLSRTSSIGESAITVGWTGKLGDDEQKRLSDLAAEFTTKRGRERRDWTERSLEQRIETVGKRFGHRVMTLIHPAFMMVYRHASEMLHGTYFGALFLWGITAPGKRPSTTNELREVMMHHQFAVLCSVIFSNAALLDCSGQYFGFQNLMSTSDGLIVELEKLPMIKEALESSQ